MAIPKNTDLTPANKTPGIYVQIQNGGAGAGDPNEQSTVLLLGEMLPGGAWAPNGVYDVTSEQDIIDGADGPWTDSGSVTTGCSTIRRQYRAVVAQVGEGNVRIKAAAVAPPSGGTAATYPSITVHVVSTSTLLAVTNPTTGGVLEFQVCGEVFSVPFTTSDTNATIAVLLRAELVKSKTLPLSTGAVSTATIPLTYNMKGALGEDCPFRANVTPGSGVYLGVGTITYTSSAAGGSPGTATLTMGTQTASAAVASGGTDAVTAAAMKAALLTDDYPLIGLGIPPASAVFPLAMRNGRDVRRVSANLTVVTTQTVTLQGGSATSGTPDATPSYNGVPGAGLPTLTTLLANIDNAGSFGEWTAPWNTTGNSSTGLNALATQIELSANGVNCKNQHLTICSVASETTAAAIAPACSPALGSSQRYVIGHQPDAGQQGYELTARRAAMFAAWISPATNSDIGFGGTPFKTSGGVPLNLPSLRIRSTRATLNAAIVDGLEPWCTVGGSIGVLRGRSCSTATEEPLWDPSDIRQRDMIRRRLISSASTTFVNPKVKADGIVTQSGEITTASVEGWAVGEIHQYEREGFYDGAEEMKSGVAAEIDQANRSKINLVVPASTVVIVHQFGVVLAKSAPSLP